MEKFAAVADQWWDPGGKLAPLHRLNPLRLRFIRDLSVQHFARDGRALQPFAGLSLVDVGCGGGLLAEPLARQGFEVVGIDAAEENIAAARAHAGRMHASLSYRCAAAEQLAGEQQRFDIVLSMEVLEHVANRSTFLDSCATLLKPGGLMFLATISRTLKALALAKFGAEFVLGWIPPGTHDWRKFATPDEISRELEARGISPLKTQGVSFDLLAWDWRLSSDTSVNYILAAMK